jgi:hypothetical protein
MIEATIIKIPKIPSLHINKSSNQQIIPPSSAWGGQIPINNARGLGGSINKSSNQHINKSTYQHINKSTYQHIIKSSNQQILK